MGSRNCHEAYLIQGLGSGCGGAKCPTVSVLCPVDSGSGSLAAAESTPLSRKWVVSFPRPRLAGRPVCDHTGRPTALYMGSGVSAQPCSGFSLMIPESPYKCDWSFAGVDVAAK